jgi:hypothetical protein
MDSGDSSSGWTIGLGFCSSGKAASCGPWWRSSSSSWSGNFPACRSSSAARTSPLAAACSARLGGEQRGQNIGALSLNHIASHGRAPQPLEPSRPKLRRCVHHGGVVCVGMTSAGVACVWAWPAPSTTSFWHHSPGWALRRSTCTWPWSRSSTSTCPRTS